jgi:hypothetical protein
MSNGCAPIWATQFGLRAGLRRSRADVTALGRLTADAIDSGVLAVARKAVLGEVDRDNEALYGFPALLVSGLLDGNHGHMGRFKLVFERALPAAKGAGAREETAMAALLAELATAEPEGRAERLALAREFAAQVSEHKDDFEEPALSAFAWAHVAKASRAPEDVAHARAALERGLPPFDAAAGCFEAREGKGYMLSLELTLTDALADLAQATGDATWVRKARALLDQTFDAAYLAGHLAHDWDGRSFGVSSRWCSGCNFHALFLVDRIYGDSWVIGDLPDLPEQPKADGE